MGPNLGEDSDPYINKDSNGYNMIGYFPQLYKKLSDGFNIIIIIITLLKNPIYIGFFNFYTKHITDYNFLITNLYI